MQPFVLRQFWGIQEVHLQAMEVLAQLTNYMDLIYLYGKLRLILVFHFPCSLFECGMLYFSIIGFDALKSFQY